MVEPASNKMQRIALGTFADPERLNSTLEELAAGAIAPDQLCLLGCSPHVEILKFSTRDRPLPHIQGLLGRPLVIALFDNGAPLVATSAPFEGIDFESERQPLGLLHDLEDVLFNGALALIVMTRTIAEFAAVTRVLLRYSTHSVRTREVARS